MTKQELLNEMADYIRTRWTGYGTWSIECVMVFPMKNGDEVLSLQAITHQEEDHIGIFDGKKYNELCGFGSMEELEEYARGENMTVEEVQDSTWSDSANEDNYEPDEDRRLRLAERLYDDVLMYMDESENLDVTNE